MERVSPRDVSTRLEIKWNAQEIIKTLRMPVLRKTRSDREYHSPQLLMMSVAHVRGCTTLNSAFDKSAQSETSVIYENFPLKTYSRRCDAMFWLIVAHNSGTRSRRLDRADRLEVLEARLSGLKSLQFLNNTSLGGGLQSEWEFIYAKIFKKQLECWVPGDWSRVITIYHVLKRRLASSPRWWNAPAERARQ